MPNNKPSGPGNVVPITAKLAESRFPGGEFRAAAAAATGTPTPAGGPDDPRMQEAMRLMEAFLAIEDATGREALVALAERLVSHDWARKVQQR
jgi:mannose/cellobiose epimerase-like protein (N-acyl-D-glucosamine 2-epimerase family)